MTPDASALAATRDALRTLFSSVLGADCPVVLGEAEGPAPPGMPFAVGIEDGRARLSVYLGASAEAHVRGLAPGAIAAAWAASEPGAGVRLIPGADVPEARLDGPTQAVGFVAEAPGLRLGGTIVLVSEGEALPILTAPSAAPSVPIARAAFADFGPSTLGDAGGDAGGDGSPVRGSFELLRDVEIEITVELGRKSLSFAQVHRLATGSVVDLDRLAGEPLVIYANGHPIGEGEAMVIGEQLGVRVTRLLTGSAAVPGLRLG